MQNAAFVRWLKSRKLTTLADAVSKIVPVKLEMNWRDQDNANDCAIYTMRHMETYDGKGLAGWDAGFRPETSTKTLKNLRIKYLARILYATINQHAHRLSAAAKNFKKL